MKALRFLSFSVTGILLLLVHCRVDVPAVQYKTRHVIIFVMDGARYSETWGDPSHQYIPSFVRAASSGVVCTGFYNDGVTNTVNGHSAMTTGYYDNLNNTGQQYPAYPSIFQHWLELSPASAGKTWVVSSKDKLAVLANCNDPAYKDRFVAYTDCGVNGLNTGYRDDSTTCRKLLTILRTYQPTILLVNFKEPDASGHANNWPGYLQGISTTDNYFGQMWDQINSDPAFAGKTTVFYTNDHGRHLDNVLDGFVSHGDGCDGCRHIMLFAAGPDFKKNVSVSTHYSQIDVAATTAELLGFRMPHSTGQVMRELFVK